MKYELYRVPFKNEIFVGLKFKEVCMILYYKLNMTLIGLEIKVGNQLKVFVNPAKYIFTDNDHWGYVIYHEKPNYIEINGMDLQNNSAENFYIMHYLKRREFTNSKKEFLQKHSTLARMFEENQKKHQFTNMENFYTEKRPKSLQEARVTNTLPKNIEGHIIVCGLIKGIKNLILPLRCKNLGRNKRPIVILTSDNVNGDTYVWPEINRFQDIYLIKGSAL